MFVLDWSFPHRHRCQQHDRLGGDRPAASSLIASVLPPRNHTFPSHGGRYEQRGRTGIGDFRSSACTLGFRGMCHLGGRLLGCSRIYYNPSVDLL